MQPILLALLAACVIPFHLPVNGAPSPKSEPFVGYLFLHFYDNYKSPGDYSTYPAGERVFGHISDGNNATSFVPLNGGAPLLTSTVGTKGVRDPYLVSKDDQSKHYIIATDMNQTAAGGFGGSFLSRGLVIWESEGPSLTKWSQPRLVKVVPENFRMAWAPEATYLADQDQFLVYWSSNKYADASHSGSPDSDKIYVSYTKDFKTFSEPQFYLALPHGVIDLSMHPTGRTPNEYVRFYKDESVYRCHGQISENGIFGDWKDIGPADKYVNNQKQSEACLFFKDNTQDKWYVWLDQYDRVPAGYYPYLAYNGIQNYGYTDLGFEQGMPMLTKHGVVKPLTQAQYDEVVAAWNKSSIG